MWETLSLQLYLNVFMQHWTKIGSENSPPARSSHTACCIAGPSQDKSTQVLVVIEGWGDGLMFSDVWLLDVDKGDVE